MLRRPDGRESYFATTLRVMRAGFRVFLPLSNNLFLNRPYFPLVLIVYLPFSRLNQKSKHGKADWLTHLSRGNWPPVLPCAANNARSRVHSVFLTVLDITQTCWETLLPPPPPTGAPLLPPLPEERVYLSFRTPVRASPRLPNTDGSLCCLSAFPPDVRDREARGRAGETS